MSEEKQPVLVEIIGESESGKTHMSLLFPNPALFDTTARMEAGAIVKKLYPGDWRERYFTVRTLKEIRKALERVIADGRKTVIVDTSHDLDNLAAKEWTDETGKILYPVTQYKYVREKVDDFINSVIKAGMNLVVTAGMRDEWVGGKSTGRRCRDGSKKMPGQADMRLYLTLQDITDDKGLHTGWKRKCKVVKNRFKDKAGEDWVSYLNEISWEAIMKITGLSREVWVE